MDFRDGMDGLTQLLDLEEFEAVELQEDRGHRLRRIAVIPRASVGICPHCQKATGRRQQIRERVVRDLPWGLYATELVVRQPQYHCPDCDRLFTPRFTALAESAHATERFLERLAALADHSDLKNASAFFSLPEKTLEHWYYAYLDRRTATRSGQPIRSLGIDELSRKKNEVGTAAC